MSQRFFPFYPLLKPTTNTKFENVPEVTPLKYRPDEPAAVTRSDVRPVTEVNVAFVEKLTLLPESSTVTVASPEARDITSR